MAEIAQLAPSAPVRGADETVAVPVDAFAQPDIAAQAAVDAAAAKMQSPEDFFSDVFPTEPLPEAEIAPDAPLPDPEQTAPVVPAPLDPVSELKGQIAQLSAAVEALSKPKPADPAPDGQQVLTNQAVPWDLDAQPGIKEARSQTTDAQDAMRWFSGISAKAAANDLDAVRTELAQVVPSAAKYSDEQLGSWLRDTQTRLLSSLVTAQTRYENLLATGRQQVESERNRFNNLADQSWEWLRNPASFEHQIYVELERTNGWVKNHPASRLILADCAAGTAMRVGLAQQKQRAASAAPGARTPAVQRPVAPAIPGAPKASPAAVPSRSVKTAAALKNALRLGDEASAANYLANVL